MSAATYPLLAELLAAQGLAGVREEQLIHPGYSGASLTKLQRSDGRRLVLKRMSIERDWIMRATDDTCCREVAFAASGIELGDGIASPTIDVASDGDGYALLMHDISDELLPPHGISERQLELVLARIAALHRLSVPSSAGVPWCDLRRRLLLLSPEVARIAAAYGAGVAPALTRGWALFEQLAPQPIVVLIQNLWADPAPLLLALAPLPTALLHGDLKLDNIGLTSSGGLWLIDWSMPMLAPPAVDLGWFLAINSRRLPPGVNLDDVMDQYARAAGISADLRARHDAAAVLCGLVLRGWRKALDADEGEPQELAWWCEHAQRARDVLRI